LYQISLPSRNNCFLFFHLFPTCFIHVPNGFPLVTPFFNEGITQDGDRKGFGRHKGGIAEKGEKMGGGGGERHYGDQKVLNRHTHVMIENLSIAM
jgi:hypothetical protein